MSAATSLGFSAVEFAEQVLRLRLVPWQRWLLIHALELSPAGGFRFRTVLVLVARQNGKTALVEVKNLWKMFVLRVPLVIGTAQNLDIAEESWDRAVELVEGTPELAAEVAHIDRTNGKKALRLAGGPRWKIAAASRKGGRGLSGDDVNLDELREHHSWESWGAVSKTTMARPRAQIWAYSNAGDDRSVVLNVLLEKGRKAAASTTPGSMGLFEWSAPDGANVDDWDALAQANPSLGYLISREALESALETDPEPVFRTECMCQHVPDLAPSKIPMVKWALCVDPDSKIAGRLVLSWEVSWDRARSAVCVAGVRDDGLPHVEVVDLRDGTDWVPERLAELAARHDVGLVTVDPSGPAGSLLVDVSEALPAELEPRQLTARDMAHACGQFFDAALTERLRHLGDDRLTAALRGSATRQLADAWAWDRKRSMADIAPLVGVTVAHWGLSLLPQSADAEVWGFYE